MLKDLGITFYFLKNKIFFFLFFSVNTIIFMIFTNFFYKVVPVYSFEFDINKIRDHHQYMFERKLEEQNEKLRSEARENNK